LTGGGANLSQGSQIGHCRGKESRGYLDVHRTLHQMGGRSTCTMLYGHVESLATAWIISGNCARLQDETGGICRVRAAALPPENNEIPVKTPPDWLRRAAHDCGEPDLP